uniref:Ig-like domain-containing protein n=1 Tax=Amphilophus citrinellus TaxID=61819 RepID=A0A3Q0RZU4_AMPCI
RILNISLHCVSFSDSSFQIIPSRLQLFEYESVSFTCEGFNNSPGWKVRNDREIVSRCSNGTVKTCSIDYAFPSDTGKYWCESGPEKSNTVNITVSTGSVILESSVYPAVEGDAMSLYCKSKMTSSNLTAEFYKDNVLVGTGYDGKLKIQKVSKSHEGLYKCKIHGVGESPESWMVIRLKSSTGGGNINSWLHSHSCPIPAVHCCSYFSNPTATAGGQISKYL